MLTVTGSPHRGSRFQAITIATDLRKTMKVTDLPPASAPKSSGKSWLIYALMAVAIAAVGVFVVWPDDKAQKEREKHLTDSLRKDSIQKVQRENFVLDSTAKAETALLARRDSLYQDSLTKHKANPKKNPKPKVDPKAGGK